MGYDEGMAVKVQQEASDQAARRHFILGTAGHIDHGKSSLVKALTGVDPDRLEEEKRRGMTIVLGFAHLPLPAPAAGGEDIDVGVVDVPGHERFIRAMVAGATGIDIGMLVVAADDGVMPQTLEHVEILDLLGVHTGLAVISKIDVAPPERIEEVKAQVGELLATTGLRGWPILAVSAKTGDGLDEIRSTVRRIAQDLPRMADRSVFRLAIDRVFTIHGRGTVVTGSVLSGRAGAEMELDLQPPGAQCRVREVQSHGSTVAGVVRGQRAALNLTGVGKESIEAGMELATPGYLTPTRYVDARVRILARRDSPAESHSGVRVSMATTEAMATLVVIGSKEIEPGGESLVQLRFARPVVAAFGQRFILRSENSHATIGGGVVIRPVAPRVRPMLPQSRHEVEAAASDDAMERMSEAIRRAGFGAMGRHRLACETGVEPEAVDGLLDRLRGDGVLVKIGGQEVHRETLAAVEARAAAYLKRHHAMKPGEPGIAKDKFAGWLGAKSAQRLGRALFERLEASRKIVVRGPFVASADFLPAMAPEDAALLEQVLKEIAAAGFDPPEWGKLKSIAPLTRQRAKAMFDVARTDPRLVSVSAELFISAEAMETFSGKVRELGAGGRKFKLADVRDALSLTRRVVQPLLEHLDRVGFTRRVGDERVLKE